MTRRDLATPLATQWESGVLIAHPAAGVTLGYTSRFWGNGRDVAGLPREGVIQFLRQPQKHTAIVREAQLVLDQEVFDGSFTHEIGWQLNGLFADCLPLYFGTRSGDWIGLAHSGWEGSLAGIAGKTVCAITERSGVASADLWCVLGPHRSLWYYEVQPDFKRIFDRVWVTSWLALCFGKRGDQLFFDNGIFNLFLLRDLGLTDLRFMEVDMGRDPRFYSHRAGENGRNLGFIYREVV